jgi:hypothetical protein
MPETHKVFIAWQVGSVVVPKQLRKELYQFIVDNTDAIVLIENGWASDEDDYSQPYVYSAYEFLDWNFHQNELRFNFYFNCPVVAMKFRLAFS